MDARKRVLIIARMSPRLNSRTRHLLEVLETIFQVACISESHQDVSCEGNALFQSAKLIEIRLAFPGKRFWYFTGLLRVLQLSIRAIWEMMITGYDIIVCSDVVYTLPGLLGKWVLRKKFVYNAHEIPWAMGLNAFLSTLFKWWERIVLKSCDLWLVPSEERANIVMRVHGIRKPFVIYQNFPVGVADVSEREKFRGMIAALSGGKPVVMFQGSVTYKRGLEQLIEAAQPGRFHLIIQGNGPLLPRLKNYIFENVTFLPSCSNSQAVAWLAAADFSFVYYENDCLNSAYACSNKFYASVFAGTPIICNRLPAFERFAQSYGGVVFCETLSSQDINCAIARVISTPGYYDQLKRELLAAREELARILIRQNQEIIEAFQLL